MLNILKGKLDPKYRTELLSVLKECSTLLEASEDSDWSEMGASELSQKISGAIEKLEHEKLPGKSSLSYLFAPTAPLQETAMANGWSDQYMELSSRFDAVFEKWG